LLLHGRDCCNLPSSGRFAVESGNTMSTLARGDRRTVPTLRARRTLASLRAGLLASSAMLVAVLPAAAQDATWLTVPVNNNFNNANNWTPTTVPAVTAFFGTSSISNLTFSAPSTTIGGWTFNAGASAYTFSNANQTLSFNGAGIVINGGSASITNNGSGTIVFRNTSTAGNASITNTGGATATIQFLNTSTAGNAAITNNRTLSFSDSSTAGNASLVNNAVVDFSNTRPATPPLPRTAFWPSTTTARPAAPASRITAAPELFSKIRARPATPPLPIISV
jgi:hypothetical protein